MVDVEATNQKLIERQRNIVIDATGCLAEEAEAALEACNRHCKTAILMILAELTAEQAQALLIEHKGFIRSALSVSGDY